MKCSWCCNDAWGPVWAALGIAMCCAGLVSWWVLVLVILSHCHVYPKERHAVR